MTTFVAAICSNPNFQKLLPQVFIAGPRVFTPEEAANFNAAAPPPVYFWSESSAWNNGRLMERYLELLAASLDHLKDQYQIIVVLDTATPHLPVLVTEAANRLNLWLVMVPSGLTWLLQPLDTHVMSCLKAFLRREHLRVASKSSSGVVDTECWAMMLARAAFDFLGGRNWGRAFTNLSPKRGESTLLRKLRPCSPEAVWRVPAGCPSTPEIKSLFPRNRRVTVPLYFRRPVERVLESHS